MSKSKKKNNPPQRPQKDGILATLKDLVTNPFEYRNKSRSWSKIMGGICLLLALCLLFYITGHM